ncbi:butyrophilin subfamily 1 member A1-like isoform X7 [Siniperca chuatsi]|uniref:butyrophilin subfamily 1 member A1-like isoform X7 n=1 Tax=Siniperca chuatsi TaxID=119488 RepID=UPI001CE0BD99|nr:butyrophilin subfamily 1 member A1-like isoform X7 [Siniperca chuatsi]
MKWKTGLILIGLVIIIIILLINANTVIGQLRCPKSRVESAVGEDVILECHVDPERDVTAGLFKLMFKSDFVLVYRDRVHSSDDQAPQFKDRAFLVDSWNLSKGKFAVKISSLMTADAGTYTCTVGTGSQKISCSIDLIIDPEENSTKGNQIDGDPKENRSPGNPTDNGGGDHNTYVTGSVIGIGIAVVLWLCQRQENNQNVAPDANELNAPLNAPDESNG